METLPNVVFLPGTLVFLLRLASVDWLSLSISVITLAEGLLYAFTLWFLYVKLIVKEEFKPESQEEGLNEDCPAVHLIEAFGDLMDIEVQYVPTDYVDPTQSADIPQLLSDLQVSFQQFTAHPASHATVWEVA